jgi:hypothetical protein
MDLCPKCAPSFWHFALILTIAGVAAFATWLTLGLSIDDPTIRLGAAAAVFLIVGGTLVQYILSCLRRHCRHATQQRVASPRPTAPGPG